MINHTEKLRETGVGCSQKHGFSEIWSNNNGSSGIWSDKYIKYEKKPLQILYI